MICLVFQGILRAATKEFNSRKTSLIQNITIKIPRPLESNSNLSSLVHFALIFQQSYGRKLITQEETPIPPMTAASTDHDAMRWLHSEGKLTHQRKLPHLVAKYFAECTNPNPNITNWKQCLTVYLKRGEALLLSLQWSQETHWCEDDDVSTEGPSWLRAHLHRLSQTLTVLEADETLDALKTELTFITAISAYDNMDDLEDQRCVGVMPGLTSCRSRWDVAGECVTSCVMHVTWP